MANNAKNEVSLSANLTKAAKAVDQAFVKAADNLTKAAAKSTVIVQVAVQRLIDTAKAEGWTVAAVKGKNSKTSLERAAVKSVFDSAAAAGFISKATAANYQTCFWIAFETDVPFSTDLQNQKAAAKKDTGEGKGKSDAEKVKSSKAVVVSRENLNALAKQFAKMLKDLNMVSAEPEFIEFCEDHEINLK